LFRILILVVNFLHRRETLKNKTQQITSKKPVLHTKKNGSSVITHYFWKIKWWVALNQVYTSFISFLLSSSWIPYYKLRITIHKLRIYPLKMLFY